MPWRGDAEATRILALLCEEIGEPLDHGLAARRYAMSGDRPQPSWHRPVTAAARLLL
ncbi:hypothetical protein GCM10010339_86540 [Streptomyces alanosinicus]|uniref:Uncharacterized protein n=1 Tax=Streptomyces alanosinicus TaxID=68171 RepID=A0A919D7L1_9ACTN|nr:hypothetical protein GCM10010339_86540 [Streptomyces alanosinicus]